MFKEKNYSTGSLKGILAAYLVLILHVVLVAAIGILVLFFRGIVNYAVLVFLASLLVTTAVVLYTCRKIKNSIKAMREVDYKSRLDSHPLEINLLGGLASFKLGPSVLRFNDYMLLNAELPQLASCEHSKRKEIVALADLLEKELITIDEYNEAKRDIFHS